MYHLIINNHRNSPASSLYNEDVNKESYSDVLSVKIPNYQEQKCLSDITKISELLVLFIQRNNTNGMVVNSMCERRTHVGRTAKALEDSFTVYSDETMQAEDRAFMLKLRDTTMAAIEEARFAQIVGKLEEASNAKITGRVQDVIELTGKTFALNQPEQDNILNYLIQGGDLSLYGLSNAITRASQDVESYDRATALEGIGWQVATMEPAQWREING